MTKFSLPRGKGEPILGDLVDTGASSPAILEADVRKLRLLSPQSIKKDDPAPNIKMDGNGRLENTKSTVKMKFDIDAIRFHEILTIME